MIETMTMPAIQIRHESGRNWAVRATWSDGHFEEIAGFPNEYDANEWVTHKFQYWLADIEKARSA